LKNLPISENLNPKTHYLILKDIAHSAFLILSLLSSQEEKMDFVIKLSEGILTQQRKDGSFKIFFGGYSDRGQALYPGEAMVALMAVFQITKENIFLESVEKGFWFYREFFLDGNIPEEETIFFGNWISQAFSVLHLYTNDIKIKKEIPFFLFQIHDSIISSEFFDGLSQSPKSYKTVEVACALEGLAYTFSMLTDRERKEKYRKSMENAIKFLITIQCKRGETGIPSRAVGGFGHGITQNIQRIDVTGHVMSSLIKILKECF
jgi:hypothetical protein